MGRSPAIDHGLGLLEQQYADQRHLVAESMTVTAEQSPNKGLQQSAELCAWGEPQTHDAQGRIMYRRPLLRNYPMVIHALSRAGFSEVLRGGFGSFVAIGILAACASGV